VKARCGDGIRQVPNEGTGVHGEACDDGVETATCTKDCEHSYCGDKYVNAAAGETCDDGAQVGGDGCDPFCHKEP
jgi:cysteine-rich repeat protein